MRLTGAWLGHYPSWRRRNKAFLYLLIYDLGEGCHAAMPGKGGKLGVVKKVLPSGGLSIAPVLKVRVSLDVRKPLLRGTNIQSKEDKELTDTFSYKRLGIFCYLCHVLGHMVKYSDFQYADDFRIEARIPLMAPSSGLFRHLVAFLVGSD
ncbi:hypothetical protein Salat_1091600 [Sesamum alatum]|uniref:Zinc knuckle CX2CX4HX4C domain-containing protein n=1 Tax=Sesamum alatum TaxID=300844 RepID=A0AAE2CSW9_9LAMI|nr:hypothetical protein Salat_1091600 [Sesamum alatum]